MLGGGYHGKSTILNAIKVGIYNKIPGDGREFVVTCSNAVAIRSEDGRYVSGTSVHSNINGKLELFLILSYWRRYISHFQTFQFKFCFSSISRMKFLFVFF